MAMALVTAVAPSVDAAQVGRPGTLDPSFGRGGKVFAEAPPAMARTAFGSAVRGADGDVIFELWREVREKEGGVRELERRLPDGSLDHSFGKDGRVVVGAGTGMALRPDGDLLVGTSSCRGEPSSMMLLDSYGVKVPGFGAEGCAQPLPFGVRFISVEPDERILVAGSKGYCPPCGHDATPHSETVVARLLPDGSPDPAFGKGGVVQTRADYGVKPSDGVEESLVPSAISPTSDGGAVVAAGTLLLRLDGNGALVPGFGKGGVAEVEGRTAGLLTQSKGDIVVASSKSEHVSVESGELLVSRFRPDGMLDPDFGNGGTTRLVLPAEATAQAIAAAPGDGVLVAGELSAGDKCGGNCASTLFLARLGSNGKPNATYGNGGVVKLSLPSTLGYLRSLGVTALLTASDGAALVVGGRYAEDAFAIARSPDGAPDSRFGEGGTLVERHYLPPNLETSGFALNSGGGFTVAAEGTAGTHEYEGFLLRFGRDGRQSRGPSGHGLALTDARGEIQPGGGGRVVSWGEGTHTVRAVNVDGKAARGYGDKGAVELPPEFHAEAIDEGPGGGVAVVGAVGDQRAMAVYRLAPNGRPLAGFGHRGLAKVRFGQDHALACAALVEADGSIVLTGSAGGRTGVARLLPNGRLDRRYGHGGRVRGLLGEGTYGTRIARLGHGVAIAATNEETPNSLAGIVRLDRRGRLVRGFGHMGAVRPHTDGPPLALLAGAGRIVVVTDTENDPRSSGGVELRAYRPGGSVDRRFGRNGLARGGFGQIKYFEPADAIQQRNGKICVAGTAWSGEYGQVELLRFR